MKKPNANQKAKGKALHKLSKHNDIIISNADQGCVVVIQDLKDCTKEAERQICIKEYYKMFHSDPTETHKKTSRPNQCSI